MTPPAALVASTHASATPSATLHRTRHVVARDLAFGQIDRLRILLDSSTAPDSAAVLTVGRGSREIAGLPRALRVRALFDLPWLGARALRHAIVNETEVGDARPLMLHAWTPQAAAWCLPLLTGADQRDGEFAVGALVVEMADGASAAQFARWVRAAPSPERVAFACNTATAERRLIEHGAAAERCAVIRDGVDFAALSTARASGGRAGLGLQATDEVVLALPPAHACDAFGIAWAVLLAQKVRPQLRLIVPGYGRPVARARHLADASGHANVVLTPGDAASLPQLLAMANVAALLPHGDAPLAACAWALAAGVPLLGSAVPCVTEFIAHGHNGWLCRPGNPRDAARRLIELLEDNAAAQRRAEVGRGEAYKAFSRQRLLEQYRQLYANVAAPRGPRDG